MDSGEETYKYRYDASLANHIELKWQSKWEEDGTYHAPNPSGPLADSTGRIDLPKLFIMDMFPYPCLLYTSPSPRDGLLSRMPSSA